MNIAKTLGMTFLMALSLAVLSGPIMAADARPDTVLAVIKSTKELSKFADMISSAGVESELKATDKAITVFAPSNDAIDDIPSDVMKKIKADKASMRTYVLYHTILGSAVFSDSIHNRRASPSTGAGEMIGFDGMGKDLVVGNTTIKTPDLGAQNGVVHVVNGPLVPLSLDDKAAKKLKDAQDEQMKKNETEMKEREAKMEASRLKKDAAEATKAAAQDSANAPAATAKESATPTASVPEKKEEKGFIKKLFGF